MRFVFFSFQTALAVAAVSLLAACEPKPPAPKVVQAAEPGVTQTAAMVRAAPAL